MRYLLLLLPLSFMFHFLEIEVSSSIAFVVTILFVATTAFFTRNTKKRILLLTKVSSICISIIAAKLFIVQPNESWFNPFSMETVIVLTDVFIFCMILASRGVIHLMNTSKTH